MSGHLPSQQGIPPLMHYASTASDTGSFSGAASQSELSDGSPSYAQESRSIAGVLDTPQRAKGLTKDGREPKKRGPKQDSKPAKNRRQEMNRRAQRTHRERKEIYVKNLEAERGQALELNYQIMQEKEALQNEVHRLRRMLIQHGLNPDDGASSQFGGGDGGPGGGGGAPSSSGSVSRSYALDSARGQFSPNMSPQQFDTPSSQHQHGGGGGYTRAQAGIDWELIGINFVLNLERPCMSHQQYLQVRAHNPENQPFHHPAENPDDADHEHMSGHALMASATPYSHVMTHPEVPYEFKLVSSSDPSSSSSSHPSEVQQQGMPQQQQLQTASLAKLFHLWGELKIDCHGEMNAIMAWQWLWHHPRREVLEPQDYTRLQEELGTKSRCYGFGAVVEEFELHDAMAQILAEKDDRAGNNPGGTNNEFEYGVPQLAFGMAQQQISAH